MGSVCWRVEAATDALAEVGRYVDPDSLLSRTERARHDRLREPVDRDDFVAARALARRMVLEHEGAPIDASALRALRFRQVCSACGGPHGRPRLTGRDDLSVSWSHAKGVVAAAVSTDRVGIDVEREGRGAPPGIAGDGGDPWLAWTRIEAITKLGAADLDTALSWAPMLRHPPSADFRVDLPRRSGVRLSDMVRDDLGVVCSLAR